MLFVRHRRAIASGRIVQRSTAMKLVTFVHQNQEHIGALDDAGRIVDLHKAYETYLCEAESNPIADHMAVVGLGRDMTEFLKRGETSLDAARKALTHLRRTTKSSDGETIFERSAVRLMAPVPRPGALISAGKN